MSWRRSNRRPMETVRMQTFRCRVRSAIVAFLAAAVAGTAALAQEGGGRTGIVIGQSAALTGPGSALAGPFVQGARLYFDKINAAGGVNGRKIELVTLDDRGNPATTAENTRQLLGQGVLSLFGYY